MICVNVGPYWKTFPKLKHLGMRTPVEWYTSSRHVEVPKECLEYFLYNTAFHSLDLGILRKKHFLGSNIQLFTKVHPLTNLKSLTLGFHEDMGELDDEREESYRY